MPPTIESLPQGELQSKISAILTNWQDPQLDILEGFSFASDKGYAPEISVKTTINLNEDAQERLIDHLCALTGESVFRDSDTIIKFQTTGPIVPLIGRGAHRHKHRPLCSGIAIARQSCPDFGTLGMFLMDNATGQPVILTAGHVVRNADGSGLGDSVYQPEGHKRRDRVGEVIYLSELLQGGFHDMDVALIAPRRGFQNKLLQKRHRSKRRNYWKIKPEASSIEKNGIVVKSGAMSGFSSGKVTHDENAQIFFRARMGGDGFAIFVNQFAISSPRGSMSRGIVALGGDSGSIVIDRDYRSVLGMIFASTLGPVRLYYATPIKTIMDKLGLSFL